MFVISIRCKSLAFCILFIFFQKVAFAQSNHWKTLSDVRMTTTGKYKTQYPIFGSRVKKLKGQNIILKGYILPIDLGNSHKFFFSFYPYNQCFFCGNAGPESVVEVHSKKAYSYTIKPVKIKGILQLNARDSRHHMYILREVEFVR